MTMIDAEDNAIQQALHNRDKCLAHLESLNQMALSRSAIAVCLIAANEFTRLERQWRRDPVHYREIFTAHHLGAALVADCWTRLADTLLDERRMPSLDLMLECVRAVGSSVNVQSITDDGFFLMSRFLMMHLSPEHVTKAWLKLSKCADASHFRDHLEEFRASGMNSRNCRRELLDQARSKAVEWQKIADSARRQFAEYAETLQNSIVPACRVDRTLGAALRDAKTRLNQAEKLCQKLLKEKARKDLKATKKPAAKERPALTHIQKQTAAVQKQTSPPASAPVQARQNKGVAPILRPVPNLSENQIGSSTGAIGSAKGTQERSAKHGDRLHRLMKVQDTKHVADLSSLKMIPNKS